MNDKELRIRFNLDHEVDRRVYAALVSLPSYYDDCDLSQAVIAFINNLVATVGECEERQAQFEALLCRLIDDADSTTGSWH